MTYLIALQLRIKHRAFPWWYCMSLARQERKGIPPVDVDGVIYGVCVVAVAILLLAMLKGPV